MRDNLKSILFLLRDECRRHISCDNCYFNHTDINIGCSLENLIYDLEAILGE